ncbi:MAG: hypothetical protein IRY99_03155 [Isosphaeraceae bacterium]|nr:hypothetical protein [Isosphaeraceae bacterium]
MESLNEIKSKIQIESEDFTVTPDASGAYVVRFKDEDRTEPLGFFIEESGNFVFRFATTRSADMLIDDDDCIELIRVIQKAGQLSDAQAELPG